VYYITTPRGISSAKTLSQMSKTIVDNASLKIKRKRAPVWLFATRNLCEKVTKLLAEEELVT
jgi:hypothetical protein